MNPRFFKTSLHAIAGGIAALFLTGPFAADVPTHQVVNGVAIYLGMMPAEKIVAGTEMHGGVPSGKHYYHLTVALFDAATGKRITDARVKARVSELALSGTEKKLEPMHIAGATNYGNYYRMPGAGIGIYRIRVHVRRTDAAQPIEAEFEYRRPGN